MRSSYSATVIVLVATLLLSSVTNAFVPSSSSSSFGLQRSFTTPPLYATAATIQFVKGLDEKVIPNVKLTRARDGSSGVASFFFRQAQLFRREHGIAGRNNGLVHDRRRRRVFHHRRQRQIRQRQTTMHRSDLRHDECRPMGSIHAIYGAVRRSERIEL